jgi:hypothetical protein
LVRRFLEVVFSARSRWHLVRLDQSQVARAQLRTLRGLLHQARATPFGREHDFARIRSAADFRRLVPLRSPAELWRDYGQSGHTWPGPVRLFATPHPALGAHLRPVALSPGLLASQRRALRTALALALHARPRARLLSGSILWLGDDTFLTTPEGTAASSASLIDARFPRLLRPAVRAGLTWDCPDEPGVDAVVPSLASRLAHESPSCLVGPAERLSTLLDHVRGLCKDPWPELAAVLCFRRNPTPENPLRGKLPSSVVLLEMLVRPEGPLAVEDPRCGGLRLLPDHGVYFELVPGDQVEKRCPPRLGLDEARVGVDYELVLSSPAGVWACRSGLHVCFDCLSPPLLRVLPGPRPSWCQETASESLSPVEETSSGPVAATIRSDGPAALPLPANHRQSGGSRAALPETFVHSPWSARADRE